MRLLLLSLSLCLSATAFAENLPTCKDSPFPLLIDSFEFGAKEEDIKAAAKNTFGPNIQVLARDNTIIVAFDKELKNLDGLVYHFTNGKMTRVLFSYSNKFMENLGGYLGTFRALAERAKEKYGMADDVDVSEAESGKGVLMWNGNGSVLHIIGQEKPVPSVQYRVDCKVLEEALQKEAAKSLNFGF